MAICPLSDGLTVQHTVSAPLKTHLSGRAGLTDRIYRQRSALPMTSVMALSSGSAVNSPPDGLSRPILTMLLSAPTTVSLSSGESSSRTPMAEPKPRPANSTFSWLCDSVNTLPIISAP